MLGQRPSPPPPCGQNSWHTLVKYKVIYVWMSSVTLSADCCWVYELWKLSPNNCRLIPNEVGDTASSNKRSNVYFALWRKFKQSNFFEGIGWSSFHYSLRKDLFIVSIIRPQGKVMFSEAPPILSTGGRQTFPLEGDPSRKDHRTRQDVTTYPPNWYWHLVAAAAAVCIHPTGIHSC